MFQTRPAFSKSTGCAILLVLLLPLAGCQTGHRDADITQHTDFSAEVSAAITNPAHPGVFIVAHRGCWERAPENSVSAIEACIESGIPIAEIDVRRTRDGVLILMHDETLDRTTNGSGTVSDITFDEVRKLRLRASGGGEKASLSNERPPTLREALEASKGRIIINIDAKSDDFDQVHQIMTELGIADQVILKKRVGPNDSPLSADPLFANSIVMPVISQESGDIEDTLARQLTGKVPAAELLFSKLDGLTEALSVAERCEFRIWVNTLDSVPQYSAGLTDSAASSAPESVWGKLEDKGVTILQTDKPEDLKAFLGERAFINRPNRRSHPTSLEVEGRNTEPEAQNCQPEAPTLMSAEPSLR